jgi:CBS domain-containing protein
MWRTNRDRPDDPQTRERETQRLSRDEYERPLYGAPPQHHGSPPQQNQGANYARAEWTYTPQQGGRFRGDPRGAWPQGAQPHEPHRDRNRSDGPAHGLADVRAHDLMTRRVATVHPASSIERAARLMDECDCGSLPVVSDNGVLVGMVTDRDIVTRIVARGRDVRSAIVADCMTEHVFACYANESVGECMRQMAHHRVRRVPIVDERGRLIGILAQGDLARHARHHGAADESRAVAEVVGEVSQPAQNVRR